jgi:hypothetical protein
MNRPWQLSALILAGALLAPAIGQAAVTAPPEQTVRAQVRVYDRAHRDNHVWDEREERAYRQHMAEQHRRAVTFQRLSRTRQNAYWNWRHQHPD